VTLTLDAGEESRVAVRLSNAEGQPIPGALVFLEEEGRGQQIFTTGPDGVASAVLEAEPGSRLRLAAQAGEAWALGDWVARETALAEGLFLQLPARSGVLRISAAIRQGVPRVLSAEGWDVSWLLSRLGSQPVLAPDLPVQIEGLPPGAYTVVLESTRLSTVVQAGRQGSVHFE
jgi:hypothetical protein